MLADEFADDVKTETDQPMPEPEWAVVEIYGRRKHAGVIVEVERFGVSLCEVREYGSDDKEPYRVHQYGGASIFSITSCTEEFARKACDEKWHWERNEKSRPLLSYKPDDKDDDEDDDFDPEDDLRH